MRPVPNPWLCANCFRWHVARVQALRSAPAPFANCVILIEADIAHKEDREIARGSRSPSDDPANGWGVDAAESRRAARAAPWLLLAIRSSAVHVLIVPLAHGMMLGPTGQVGWDRLQVVYKARVIRARLDERALPPPFRYRHLGTLATIGRRSAVADFGLIQLRGPLA